MINQVSRTVLYASSQRDASTILKSFKSLSGGESVTVSDSMATESLQDYVNRIMLENPELSEVKVSKRAAHMRKKISAGYVSNIRSGSATNISIERLKALAAGLGRPAEEVLAVAFGKALTEDNKFQESLFASLWNEFQHLSPGDQKEMRPMIEMVRNEIQRRLKT
jgi:transcriptional regulator with XRE-family HTH domain